MNTETGIKNRHFIRSKDYWGFFVILLSFLAAICLSILPLPLWMNNLWPLWIVLVLIFWAAYLPHVLSPWVVWFVGLLNDVIQGSWLGEHALAFTVVYFISYWMSRQIKVFPLWAQIAKIAMILFVYQALIAICQQNSLKDIFFFIFPLLTSLILWPWMLFLMRGIAMKFYIHHM